MSNSDGPNHGLVNHIQMREIAAWSLTLGLGAIGGYAFLLLGTPLPWMMGALCVTMIAAFAGAPLRSPGRLRDWMVAVIGLMVGSAFTPDTLSHITNWLMSLSILLVFTVVVILILGWGLCRYFQYSPADAFCSSAPGGFASMLVIGDALGGDQRTIALMHSIRIMLTVILIPWWFQLYRGYVPNGTAAFGTVSDLSLGGSALLVVCTVAGYVIGKKLRVPLYFLIGPMVVSAAVHGFGLTTDRPPGEAIAIAQIVMGIGAGCRFLNTRIRDVLPIFKAASIMTVCMLAFAVLFAYSGHLLTGLPFEAMVLAFSPGGVAEMNVITVSLGIDPVYVATHHFARLVFLLVAAPLLVKTFAKRMPAIAD